MSVTTADLLAWADATLASSAGCEVSVRASISRAYYASLHATKHTFAIEAAADTHSSHQRVIDDLALRARQPGQGRACAGMVAKLLPRLKRLRVLADYRLGQDVSDLDGAQAVATAQQIALQCAEAERLMAQ